MRLCLKMKSLITIVSLALLLGVSGLDIIDIDYNDDADFQEKILKRLDKMVGKINDLQLKVSANTHWFKALSKNGQSMDAALTNLNHTLAKEVARIESQVGSLSLSKNKHKEKIEILETSVNSLKQTDIKTRNKIENLERCKCDPQMISHYKCEAGWTGPLCADDVDECLNQPCKNNGMCENTPGGFECKCEGTGFEGNLCQMDVDECLNQPCKNNGICENTVGGFKCKCEAGWTGPQCADDLDECLNKPCKNNGVCKNTRGGFQCDCTGTGFEGDRCQTDVDECLNQPCENNGICENTQGGHECRCEAGWTGPQCADDVDECLNQPCKNNGICLNTLGGYNCDCEGTGFEGDKCQNDEDECLNQPCKDNRTCTNTLGGFKCECEGAEFESDQCEWIQIHIPSGNYSYLLSPTDLTWNQAKEFCEEKGGYLAEIKSQSEQSNIETILESPNSYWIGMTDLATEGEFVWQGTSTSVQEGYTNWSPGEPNNGGGIQDCGQLWQLVMG